jgi:hypothetical protein
MRRFSILGDSNDYESTGFATFLTAGQGLQVDNSDLDTYEWAMGFTMCLDSVSGTILANVATSDGNNNWKIYWAKGALSYGDALQDINTTFAPTIGVVYQVYIEIRELTVKVSWRGSDGSSGNDTQSKAYSCGYDSRLLVGTDSLGSRCPCYIRDVILSYGALTPDNYFDLLYDRSDTYMFFPLRTDLGDLKEGFTLASGSFSGCSWGYIGDTSPAKKWQ